MSQKQNNFPPVKIAILIDGGFFLKRFNALFNRDFKMSPSEVANHMYTMALKHVGDTNTLYRIFYYDCEPLKKKAHHPMSHKPIDFSQTEQYKFKMQLFEELRQKRKVALRLGTLKDNNNWIVKQSVIKSLIAGQLKVEDIKEDDITLEVRQKGIDMKIGVDIATLTLKRFVDCIVLFSGDSDFVPAAKLARREGVDFILDPMHANVEPQLFEHIDGMKNVSPFVRKSSKCARAKSNRQTKPKDKRSNK